MSEEKVEPQPQKVEQQKAEEKVEQQKTEEKVEMVETIPKEVVEDKVVASKRTINEETKNSKDTQVVKKQKIEEKPAEKPKFVFGGGSTFSQGFKFNKGMIPSNVKKAKENDSVVKEFPVKEETTSSKKSTPVFGTFGSSTTFGQGFGLLKEIQKKKDVDKETEEQQEIEHKPILTKLETVESGEENEDIVFNSNTKMYSLTSLKEGWKERGVGPIHLNHNKEEDSYRLVIRQRLTFQVLLNLKIVKGIKIFKGLPGSSNSEKFVRMVVTVDKQVVQYCMKLKSEDLADELFDKLESSV